MKKEIGALLATATIVTGCDQDWSHILERPAELLTPRVEIELPSETYSSNIPPSVAAQIPNAVAIVNDYFLADGSGVRGACSGVRVSDNFYLSAGHCDTPPNIIDERCQEFTLSSPGPVSVEAFSKAARIPAPTIDYDTVDAKDDDLLLLQSGTAITAIPTSVYDNPADTKVGTQLYSINFQPTIDGHRRNPDASVLQRNERPTAITTPAIVGMIAVKKHHDQTLLALTINQSLGETHDTLIRGGASGSPIYDDKGILVGIMNGTQGSIQTIGDYENSANVDVSDLPDDTPANLVTIKTITTKIIEQLHSEQEPILQCD